MKDGRLENLKGGVATACRAFITLARLHAVRNLGGRDVVSREAAAQDFVAYVDAASLLQEFAHRYYRTPQELISWPSNIQPDRVGVLAEGVVDLAILDGIITQVAAFARDTVSDLTATAGDSVLTRPLLVLLQRVVSPMPPFPNENCSSIGLSFKRTDRLVRALRGPTAVHLGPHFRLEYSMLDHPSPDFGDSTEQNVAYFWTMAARETLASQMCALSAVEYDGLPLAFYSDMAKQCWDEARHSLSFVRLAKKLANGDDQGSQNENELAKRWFEPEDKGFPIPREGNFYEAMLNADLVQRLVLMNQRSEAPAIPEITKRLASDFCKRYAFVAEFYEFDRVDETSHASIGNRWLRHLIPDDSERGKAIEETDLLRSFLIMTTFAHHGGGELAELADRFSH